jgi:hypothetical protein
MANFTQKEKLSITTDSNNNFDSISEKTSKYYLNQQDSTTTTNGVNSTIRNDSFEQDGRFVAIDMLRH